MNNLLYHYSIILGAFISLHCSIDYAGTFAIQSITSYDQVRDLFVSISPETLILFDVDDTLIEDDINDAFLHNVDDVPLSVCILFRLKHPSPLVPLYWESFRGMVWQRAPWCLIEANIVDLIKQMQQRGCAVLGLTSMESGSYGIITPYPEWRYAMLHGMGIDFSRIWPDTKFDNFPIYRCSKPILYKGILCANQQPKGDVLKALLTTYDLHTSHIIFFDDSSKNLQSVGCTCQEMNIPCTLYHYQGAHNHAALPSTSILLHQLDQLYLAYSQDITTAMSHITR